MFPKPNFSRNKRKRGNITRITQAVKDEIERRLDYEPKCERCGTMQAYAFERAHLIKASQGGRGDHPAYIALLCGPSVNTGTCHNFADYTAAGREWRIQKHQELLKYYEEEYIWKS